MADPTNLPSDPNGPPVPADDLDRRLATLALLPVPDRPALADPFGAFAPMSEADDSAEPFAVDGYADGDVDAGRRRSHRLWALAGVAAALVLVVAGVVAFGRDRGGDLAASGALSDSDLTDALRGHEYRSVSVTEAGVARTILGEAGTSEPGQVTLTFRQSAEVDTVSAVAACNHHGFVHRIEDGQLVTADGMMSQTQIDCDGPQQEQDTWLAGIISSSPTLALDGDRLTVTSGDTVIELVDAAVADPDRPLVGTTWTLETIVSGDTVTSVQARIGDEPTLVVSPSAVPPNGLEVVVNDGCGTGRGPVTVADSTITSEWMNFDAVTCADSQDFGSAMQPVLTGEATYEIDGSQLTLTGDGDRGLVFRAASGAPPDEGGGSDATVTTAVDSGVGTLQQGSWTGYDVGPDDRSVTFTLGCAYTGAERFDHAEVTPSVGTFFVAAMVLVPTGPEAAAPCTADRGTFTVVLDEPLAGRTIFQPSQPSPLPPP